jgi:hypothetical protein
VLDDDVVPDRAPQHAAERSVVGPSPGPVQGLVGKVPKPRGEAEAEQFEQPEEQVGVAVGVGVVLADGQAVLVEEPVEDECGLSELAVHDADPELAALVRHVAVHAHAPPHPEVAGKVAGVQPDAEVPKRMPSDDDVVPGPKEAVRGKGAVVADKGGDRLPQRVLPEA